MTADERRVPDFAIDAPDGSTIEGCFCPGGRVALYGSDGRLIRVGPADLDFIRSFGKVRAGALVAARLELERGTFGGEL